MASWIDHCLTLAATHAAKSKDSTQVGCFIAGPNNEPLSLGFNGPPIRVADTEARRQRPEKYLWFAHAEENAVALAARSGHRLEGATAYVTHFPCARCAGMLIQAGIQDVYIGDGVTSMDRHEFEVAAAKFHEAGVWARVRGQDGEWRATGSMSADELEAVLRRAAGGQFKAEAVPDADGWIAWEGGLCPVPGGTWTEVRFLSGHTSKGECPEGLWWGKGNGPATIVAYRSEERQK